MSPTYAPVTGNEGNDSDSVYEERDLGQMFDNVNARHASRNAAPPDPTRSSYGSPHSRTGRRTSLEVGQIYNPARSYVASSAPSAYAPYRQSDDHSGRDEHVPGAYALFGAHSEPAVNDYYWYAGAPPSVASSNTAHGARYFSSRASAPAGMYDEVLHGQSPPAGMFGVRAPHHHPGHRYSEPRQGEHLPNFPQWSRTWYDGHHSANGHAYTYAAPPSGATGWESVDTMTRSGGYYAPPYGVGRRGGDVDLVKQERIRMLEKQFGKPKISHAEGTEGADDAETVHGFDEDEIDDANLPLGSVNSAGKLIVERPRWRLAVRCLIGLAAIACVGTGIGGALLIKPGSSSPAARGSIASFVIYGCSVITLLVILYLYVFRRCCGDPMRKELSSGGIGDNPLAGMVIPVLSAAPQNAGKGFGFGKRGRKAWMMQQQQAPTVNLIVDPALLGERRGRGSKRNGDEDFDENGNTDYDERLPGDARRSSRRKNGVGVLGNIQIKRRWMIARKQVKLLTVWDAILCVAWIAASIVALGLGKSCPTGSGNGWCNYYNGAISCGVILAVLFLVALYFDYRDLQVSKKPPKPPM